MRFESLLAGRYSKAQKRQSVFTVLSIAMAVATMTVIFVLFGVSMYNARKTALEQAPYHLALFRWPQDKAAALQNADHVKSVTFEQNGDGTLTAKIFLKRGIGSKDGWLHRVARENGVELTATRTETGEDGSWQSSTTEHLYEWNEMLISLNLVDDESVFGMMFTFLVILFFSMLFCLALRLVVDTAFEISSKERERHYGVLQSIGATPKQIVGIITREGLRLCLMAIPLGLGAGVLMAYGMFRSVLTAGAAGMPRTEPEPVFAFSPLMLLVAAAVGAVWTFFSAYGVGMRVVKKTPIDAIQGRGKRVETVKRRSLSGLLFGLPGKLAARNARREKKRFGITVLALTVSITLFALFSFLTNTVEELLLYQARHDSGGSDFSVWLREDSEAGISLSDGVKVLEDSDLFQRVEIETIQWYYTDHMGEDNRQEHIIVCYCNSDQYRRILGEHPALSYEELVQSRGYVFAVTGAQTLTGLDDDEQEVFTSRAEIYSNNLADAETGRMKVYSRYYAQVDEREPERRPHEIRVCAVGEAKDGELYPGGILVSTLETYSEIKNEWFGQHDEGVVADLYCGPIETHSYEEYRKVNDYLQAHADYFGGEGNIYGSYRAVLDAKSTTATIRTAVFCLNLLLGLAALVNLLNIVSTGIANRRSELASLQCVGMTEGQLFRLSAIECLQFVLRAAASSALIVGAVLGGARLIASLLLKETDGILLDGFGDNLIALLNCFLHPDLTTIILRIALLAAAAFVLSFAASWIMLRSQNRCSLSDRVLGEDFEMRGRLPQNDSRP